MIDAMAELLVATTNAHKLDEMRAIFEPLGLSVIGLDEAPGACDLSEPDENGLTFQENARIKARAYALALGRRCLADDSGLEVDALGGAPGVRSARYASAASGGADRNAQDQANCQKLLHELQGVAASDRAARFVCAMCLAAPDGEILAESRGEMPGVIGAAPRGEHGFGYDPLLVLDQGVTSAELSPAEKNARSHRGAAARAIAPIMLKLLGASGGTAL